MTNRVALLPLLERSQEAIEALVAVDPNHQFKFFNLLGLVPAEVELRDAAIQTLYLERVPLSQRPTFEQEVFMYCHFIVDLEQKLSVAKLLKPPK